jgi:phage-related protein
MSTFPSYKPDANSSYDYEPRSLEAQFGDAYNQSAGDGLNPYAETWNLTFSNRPKADIAAIKAFLISVRDVTPFDWQAPDDTTSKKWKMKGKFSISDGEADTRTISFVVKRWFGA